jgi:hypothetical protein
MVARDFRNRIIREGALVQYIGTRTQGKVDKISTMNSETWIKIDSTGLFYRSDYLELVNNEKKPQKKSSIEMTIKEKVLHSKGFKVAPTQISDHNDGPGYGGG